MGCCCSANSKDEPTPNTALLRNKEVKTSISAPNVAITNEHKSLNQMDQNENSDDLKKEEAEPLLNVVVDAANPSPKSNHVVPIRSQVISHKKQNKTNHRDAVKMTLLAFGYCRREQNKKNFPEMIINIISTFSEVVLFGFKINKFKHSFDITQINDDNNNNIGKYNVQKIDHQEHETIIFGKNLKRKTFESKIANLVFDFRIINGKVNLMFVPGEFNQFQGLISKQHQRENNYKILHLRPRYNYEYDQILRVEIDCVNLSATITNLSTRNKTTIQFDDIKSKKIRIAFAMINPYAEFEIINQFWKRKSIAYNSRQDMEVDYNLDQVSSDDEDEDDDMNGNCPDEPEFMSAKPSIDTSKLPKSRILSGLNYIGHCDNHIGIYNKGYGEDIRPNEEHEDRNIICNRCSLPFECETMILHDCTYAIKYKLQNRRKQGLQKIKGVAYPDYIDIRKDITKYKTLNYLSIDVDPNMEL